MFNLYTALITPYNEDNKVDYNSLGSLINESIENGVVGFVVNGTTGEAPTLTKLEKREILKFVLEQTKDANVDIVVGVSSNDTSKVIEEIKNVDDLAFSTYMICPPYYNKTSQAGLLAHYLEAAKNTDKNILLYNVPGRCGMSIAYETVIELSNHKQFVGIKEASK